MTHVPHSDSELFRAAVELEPEQRAAFLDRACGDNSRLRDEVESLLRAHDPNDSFLQTPVVAVTTAQPRSERLGTMVGPYKIREQIGEGGFGVVYVAEQEKPVRRKVALKVIKLGMDTRDVIARFEAERQALALMDHPNVARVLDAGASESGRPYFVMELVQGVTITEFCDRNRLPARARVELFIDVCRAVQHAHQKGIIHRDLKPSNVMVTLHDGKPVVKVIDFGVSKALSQQLTEKSIYTAYGQMIGTPSYMSPEQAEMSGLGIDTRSDIYSLGVLLYELLTGRTPLDANRLRASGYAEIMRIIREEEPPRPSLRVSTLGDQATVIAQARHTDPQQLRRDLFGELDWIVMKCLEKDRSRRYETANGLARDIERYLGNEPVEACPPSTWYRLTKTARKHCKLCLTAGAFMLLLIGGAMLASWLAVRARFAERQAIEARDSAEQALHNEQIARADAVAARSRAESFSQRLREATHLADEGIEQFNRGNWTAAHASFQRAQDVESELWSIYAHRAALYLRLGLWDEAKRDYDERRRISAHSDARTLYEHAVLQLATGDDAGYRQTCQELLQQAESLDFNYYLICASTISPDPGVDAAEITRRSEDRLTAQFSDLNSFLTWRAHLRAGNLARSQQRLEWETPAPTETPGGVHRVSHAYRAILFQEQGKTAEAQAELATIERAIDEWTREMLDNGIGTLPVDWWGWLEAQIVVREARTLLGMSRQEDPRLAELRERSLAVIDRGDAKSIVTQAREQLQRQDWKAAAASFSQLLDHMPLTIRGSSPHMQYCLEMVQNPELFERLSVLRPNDSRLWLAKGRWLANQKRWAEAVADYHQALRCFGEHIAATGTKIPVRLQRHRANMLFELAMLLHLSDSAVEYQKLCASIEARQAESDDPFSFSCLSRALTLGESGLSDSSTTVHWGQIAADAQPDSAWNVFSLGVTQYRAGDFDAAEKSCEKSLEVHPTWYGRGVNYIVLAMACQRLDRHDDALKWLEQARGWLEDVERRKDASELGLANSDYLSDWLNALVLLPEAEAIIE
jgi:serine/threonine protein kinase/tetratricopeptide (TPR) repeat protein